MFYLWYKIASNLPSLRVPVNNFQNYPFTKILLFLQIKTLYSKSNSENYSVIPLIVYNNVETEKISIFKDNKGKTGIYRWINLVNYKTYIGSASDLTVRFWVYFSKKRLTNSNMVIYKAILKYGYENFRLEILEYCDKNILLVREQYYMDLLKPEYNVLNQAGSNLGYKHKVETLEKFKIRKFSKETLANIVKAAKSRILSKEIRTKISIAKTGIKLSDKTRAKLSAIVTAKIGVAVEVTNIITNEIKRYITITSAALAIGVSRTTVKKAINSGKVIKKTYIVKSIDKK
jgi:group I intron endonuclease